MTSGLRAAFIGAGNIAAFHRKGLQDVDGIDLVGITDADPALRGTRAEEWGVHAYDDAAELLADDAVDAVYVLTPHRFHTELGLAAIAAGKHVLIEKPVATTAEDLERLLAAGRAAQTVVMPGHNYTYVPEFQRALRLVRDGALGEIRAVWITYALRHPEDYPGRVGGAIEDLFTHPAYLALALLGRPDRVTGGTAGGAALGTEDQAWMTIDVGRATGHLFTTFAVDDHSSDPWSFHVKVLGTEGSTSMSWRGATIDRPMNANVGMTLPIFDETFAHESAALRDAIARGVPPLSTLEDAADCWDLLAAGRRAAADGVRVSLGPRRVYVS